MLEQLDPLWVLSFLVLLSAFSAGLELAKMSKIAPKPKLAWEKDQPSRWKGTLYVSGIVVIIVGTILFLELLSYLFPIVFN
jgi:hypothetical protein